MKSDWRETLAAAFDRPLPVEEPVADPYAFDPNAPPLILDLTPDEKLSLTEYRWAALDASGAVMGEFWAISQAAEALATFLYPGLASYARGGHTGRLKANRLRRLSEAQNWRCCYCHGQMRMPHDCDGPNEPDMATLEHVTRVTDGGGSTWDNLIAACQTCNSHRGSVMPLKWWKLRQKLLPDWPACSPITDAARYALRGYGLLRRGW
ncbi:HNH endonuclease [Caulobacter phage CcrRogue]|uniref:Putative HNH homing endonuclease n=1 Tax=Caulobacter phage CcrRogue TaxID=2927986 RepID=K4JR78_9CAUD|nr:HNH endonuclease [Caulobacter phage CcrRogue]AFU86795.1 putative HNH homing endonuclease [Caulobacter phage CcrRogue]